MRPDGHAVVLGAGVAGLLSAAALVEVYGHVTVLERDPAAGPATARRGVPQGRHAHAVMPRGAQALEELLPGITRRLVDAGAVVAEPLRDYRFRVGGHPLRQAPIGALVLQASRPFLEYHLRAGVRECGRVDLVAGCDAVGLLIDDTERVVGVRIIRRDPGSAEELLDADLVVDATGRAGRTAPWLADLGYARPREERFAVDVAYASRYLRFPSWAAGIEKAVGTGPVPGLPRGVMMLAVEGDRRLLTLAGFTAAHHPPVEPDAFLSFAESVTPPDVFAAIRAAEPLTDITTYRYPAYLRRHYRRLRRFPAGLVITGDALCSFSPVYAQGMTVAALQALALRASAAADPRNPARSFFAAADRIISVAWRMGVSADLALPEVAGPRPVTTRVLNRYMRRVFAAAATDDVVSRQLMRVTGLLDPPVRLFRPAVLRRTLRADPGAAAPVRPGDAVRSG
jgi:2-polyprenyl-6-methoxyphenol hydroxylase-like FAD-dependent oxidoreductase